MALHINLTEGNGVQIDDLKRKDVKSLETQPKGGEGNKEVAATNTTTVDHGKDLEITALEKKENAKRTLSSSTAESESIPSHQGTVKRMLLANRNTGNSEGNKKRNNNDDGCSSLTLAKKPIRLKVTDILERVKRCKDKSKISILNTTPNNNTSQSVTERKSNDTTASDNNRLTEAQEMKNRLQQKLREIGVFEDAKVFVKWDVLFENEVAPQRGYMGMEANVEEEVTFQQQQEKKNDKLDPIEKYNTRSKWFSGTLSRQQGIDGQGRSLYKLNYDADPSFEECTRIVAFDDKGEMFDLEDEEYMTWITEKEYNSGTFTFSSSDSNNNNASISINEIVEEQNKLDKEDGGSLIGAGMNAFKTLPHDKQISLALGYRKFADTVKEKLLELHKEKTSGSDNHEAKDAITSEDIARIISSMIEKKD